MALIKAVLYASLVVCYTHAKTYKKCELARELLYVHRLPEDQIATWVCIAKHESNYDTSAINRGSGDHGIFQISDLYWCSPPGSGYACNLPCSAFEDDDITDDVGCIKTIFEEHTRISGNGFNAWTVYPIFCKGDVSGYTTGCFDSIDNTISNGEETEKPVYEFPQLPSTEKPYQEEDEDDYYEFPPLPSPPKTRVTASELNYEEPFLPARTNYPSTFLDYSSYSNADSIVTESPYSSEYYYTNDFSRNASTSFYTKEYSKVTTTERPFVSSTSTKIFTTKKYSKATQEESSTYSSISLQNRFDFQEDYRHQNSSFPKFSSTKKYTQSTASPSRLTKASQNTYFPSTRKAIFTTVKPFTRRIHKPFNNLDFSSKSTKSSTFRSYTPFSRKFTPSTHPTFPTKFFSTTPKTFSLRSTTEKPTYSTRSVTISTRSLNKPFDSNKSKTTFYKKFPSTSTRSPSISKVSRQLPKPNGLNHGPHQTFYNKADKLEYNFFTKTYGFKLVGQF